MEERLQKIIARAGVASRRHAEQLIRSGQVTLNGEVVTQLGTKADAARDHIKVSGKLLHSEASKTYVALHKPPEVVATMSDPEGRRSLSDLLHGISGRVFPIGRLEYHASGLLLLTSDGELANRILRAHSLPQSYWLKIKGVLNEAETQHVAKGVGLRLRRMKQGPNAWYEVTLNKARGDELRKSLAGLGHPVEKMRRVKLGNVELGTLPPGQYRYLDPNEVAGLERAAAKALDNPSRANGKLVSKGTATERTRQRRERTMRGATRGASPRT